MRPFNAVVCYRSLSSGGGKREREKGVIAGGGSPESIIVEMELAVIGARRMPFLWWPVGMMRPSTSQEEMIGRSSGVVGRRPAQVSSVGISAIPGARSMARFRRPWMSPAVGELSYPKSSVVLRGRLGNVP